MLRHYNEVEGALSAKEMRPCEPSPKQEIERLSTRAHETQKALELMMKLVDSPIQVQFDNRHDNQRVFEAAVGELYIQAHNIGKELTFWLNKQQQEDEKTDPE